MTILVAVAIQFRSSDMFVVVVAAAVVERVCVMVLAAMAMAMTRDGSTSGQPHRHVLRFCSLFPHLILFCLASSNSSSST